MAWTRDTHPFLKRRGVAVIAVYAPLAAFHLIMTRYEGYLTPLVLTNLMAVANGALIVWLSGFSRKRTAMAAGYAVVLMIVLNALFRFKHDLEFNHFAVFGIIDSFIVLGIVFLFVQLLLLMAGQDSESRAQAIFLRAVELILFVMAMACFIPERRSGDPWDYFTVWPIVNAVALFAAARAAGMIRRRRFDLQAAGEVAVFAAVFVLHRFTVNDL